MSPSGLFIDASNTLYAMNRQLDLICIWTQGSNNFSRTVQALANILGSIFVAMNGDIYVAHQTQGQVYRWAVNNVTAVVAATFNASCTSIFMDTNNSLYCSMTARNQVVRQVHVVNNATKITVAGTGVNGSASDQLREPAGIYVDKNMNLYVADMGNNRIQKFRYDQKNGTTVAGNGSVGTISLNRPYAVVLDGDGYMFIIEVGSHRVIGSGPRGFRCVAACGGVNGSSASQLSAPMSLALNSFGGIFVMDSGNNRLQEFMLAGNFCSKFYFCEDSDDQ